MRKASPKKPPRHGRTQPQVRMGCDDYHRDGRSACASSALRTSDGGGSIPVACAIFQGISAAILLSSSLILAAVPTTHHLHHPLPLRLYTPHMLPTTCALPSLLHHACTTPRLPAPHHRYPLHRHHHHCHRPPFTHRTAALPHFSNTTTTTTTTHAYTAAAPFTATTTSTCIAPATTYRTFHRARHLYAPAPPPRHRWSTCSARLKGTLMHAGRNRKSRDRVPNCTSRFGAVRRSMKRNRKARLACIVIRSGSGKEPPGARADETSALEVPDIEADKSSATVSCNHMSESRCARSGKLYRLRIQYYGTGPRSLSTVITQNQQEHSACSHGGGI